MANKSVNINHSDAAILSSDGSYIKLGVNSAVKIGTGSNISNGNINNLNTDVLKEYAGAIRLNKTTNKLEYCNGKTWLELATKENAQDSSIIYSFIF